MKIRYTKRALRDLSHLELFLKAHSPRGASRVASRIRKRINDLELFPYQGSPAKQGRRMLVVTQTPYLVIYRATDVEVQILTIIHASQRRRS
ncbi:MAG: type II toxin-antitoxin system RelE/ParE family toxin [Pseudomonadota bacterium]